MNMRCFFIGTATKLWKFQQTAYFCNCAKLMCLNRSS